MKVMKRNGTEVIFDITKIIAAITKANNTIEEDARMTPVQIQRIAESVELSCQKMNRSPSVEEIQDLVESQIMAHGAYEVAKNYITYRYVRSLVRKSNTTDEKILSLIECCNEEAKQENSNKNPVVNSTQRDYMAGEVSRDLSERLLLPADIVEAHREGIIHFHDSDYYAQHMHNCDLVNLEDMLQNGTVITDTLIERPHSFSTACNIATQIIAQVASNQRLLLPEYRLHRGRIPFCKRTGLESHRYQPILSPIKDKRRLHPETPGTFPQEYGTYHKERQESPLRRFRRDDVHPFRCDRPDDSLCQRPHRSETGESRERRTLCIPGPETGSYQRTVRCQNPARIRDRTEQTVQERDRSTFPVIPDTGNAGTWWNPGREENP